MVYYKIKYRKNARHSWSTSNAVFTTKAKAKSAVAGNNYFKNNKYQTRIVQVKNKPKNAQINMR